MEDVQDPATRANGPIFIVGAKGSGTTLMRLMLDSHPNIAVPQETGFARALMAQERIPFWKLGRRWWRRLGYTDAAFREHLRTFYDDMFLHYARQHGKQRWGEKTPFHVWHIRRLVRMFPDAVFIGMARHPGGNVGSLQSRFKYSVEHGIEHWISTNPEVLRQAGKLGDRFILCRYEDLVLHPEEVMRELLNWLGEPWSSAVLEHHLVQKEQGAPHQVEGRTRPDDPIDVSRVSKWAQQMSPQARNLVARRAARLAAVFDYAMDQPAPSAPLGADGAWLLTGPEVAARAKSFPIQELEERPVPRLRDQPLNPRRVDLVRLPKQSSAEGTTPGGGTGESARSAVWNRSRVAAASPLARRMARGLPPSVRRRLRERLS